MLHDRASLTGIFDHTIRYDNEIFIVHLKAERVSLIYSTVLYTEKIMGETNYKKRQKKFRSARISQKTMKSVPRK